MTLSEATRPQIGDSEGDRLLGDILSWPMYVGEHWASTSATSNNCNIFSVQMYSSSPDFIADVMDN